VSAICNRGGVTAEDLGVPRLESLARVSYEAFEATGCPHCTAREPIVADIAHGKLFRDENPDYPGGYIELLAA
jgi:orotate phosphoribosyltransferase